MLYATGQMPRSADQNPSGRRLRAVLRYRPRRRDERETVRDLLRFLRSRSVLYSPLYHEHPVAALGCVRRVRTRLKDELDRLPDTSRAFWPIREMHEACLGFQIQIEPLPVPGDTELLPDRLVGGTYWRTLERSLLRLRETFGSRMDELCEEYAIEQPLPSEMKVYATTPPWLQAVLKSAPEDGLPASP